MGVRRLMEFLGNVVPFVSEMPKVQNTEGKEVAPDANGPESLYFFKTSVEPHIGEVSYFKVMSGKVHEGDDLLNADRGSKERIAQIYVVAGGNLSLIHISSCFHITSKGICIPYPPSVSTG